MKIEIVGAQLDQYANTLRVISFDQHGTIYDIRDISGDARKTVLALACRRARGLLRALRRFEKNELGHAAVYHVDSHGTTVLTEPPIYCVK